ncbi:hypothetical protein GOV11_02060 [Candidatus Woesearchaeota archaeon]|nr:hypothetical protein [Candidatus Woesearchaeota archaeon]
MKRAQAALEFITTYGWAIMIVLVMIGALSYFGVTNPKEYLPEKCIFKTGFNCLDFAGKITPLAANKELTMVFTLKNGLGKGIIIADQTLEMTVEGTLVMCYEASAADAFQPSANDGPFTIPADTSMKFVCDFPTILTFEGDSKKGKVDFDYTESGGFYPKIASGELSVSVLP